MVTVRSMLLGFCLKKEKLYITDLVWRSGITLVVGGYHGKVETVGSGKKFVL